MNAASFIVLMTSTQVPDDQGLRYAPMGRRDPFVPLTGARPENRQCGRGLAGTLASELALRGIVEVRGERRALLADGHGATHLAKAGDRLCNGSVVLVAPGRVVLGEDADPGALPRPARRELLLNP